MIIHTVLQYQPSQFTVDGKTKNTTTDLVSTYTNKFGSTGTAVSEYTYTYDAWGSITKIKDLAGRQRTYTYNEYGEITKANETYSDGTTTAYAYTYDDGGNILTETIGNTVHRYTYDTVWKDKLTSYDDRAITYDELGRPKNYMGKSMTWDKAGKLTSVGNDVNYTYLSDGQRYTKTANGKTTTYNYNNGLLLSETNGDETLRYYYDSTGKIISFTYQKGTGAETAYFYTRNMQGDITAIYRNSDSKLIGTYEYDLWGKLVKVKEAPTSIDTQGVLTKNPFRYRGYYYDTETGFYNLNARYYDPEVRRFISPDNMDVMLKHLGDSIIATNLYVYCLNNPINYYDPKGEFAISTCVLIGIGIGALIGGLIGGKYGYDKAIKKGVSEQDSWKYVLGYGLCGVAVGGSIGGILGYGLGVALGAEATSGLAFTSISSAISSINANTQHHIMQSKHGWDQALNNATWSNVKDLIATTMQKGSITLINQQENILIYEAIKDDVVVRYAVINDAIRIADAWIQKGL